MSTNWSIESAKTAYNLMHWGNDYFDINEEGHIVVRPGRRSNHKGVDLYKLAYDIRDRGLPWPVLVRITDILHDRVDELCGAFQAAIEDYQYQGKYTAVFPIKVNQQRTVVEHILSHGNERVGLEAGSKPELLVVLAHGNPNDGIIICNGYKDREYIRLALIGRKLGYRIHIVVEKQSELDLIMEESANLGIKPLLGIRIRLSSVGQGKWQNTGGEKSKFGLSATQLLHVVDRLRNTGDLDCLQLIHFHLGSQLPNIRDIQKALNEVGRYYSELHRLGATIKIVDVGGGLGVDYEGTRTRSFCSMNYSVQEYANDVVHALWEICTRDNLPHPGIITESGRALTAYHALLITNVIDIEQAPGLDIGPEPSKADPLVLHNLWQTLKSLNSRSALEAYHDAQHWLSEAQTAYAHGVLKLEHRARAEQLYYAICRGVLPLLQASAKSHREIIDDLNDKLADKYFCNLSIFQSVPDVWAIDQIFPIAPLHRLNEIPDRRATLQDLTCDSDGAIEYYVDQESIHTTLSVHDVKKDEPYLLGIFMVGAYQEILGDMHNLFGDTHSINLEFTADGSYTLSEPEEGDTVSEVLSYVHYSPESLARRYREKIHAAKLPDAEGRSFLKELEGGLTGYTYLED